MNASEILSAIDALAPSLRRAYLQQVRAAVGGVTLVEVERLIAAGDEDRLVELLTVGALAAYIEGLRGVFIEGGKREIQRMRLPRDVKQIVRQARMAADPNTGWAQAWLNQRAVAARATLSADVRAAVRAAVSSVMPDYSRGAPRVAQPGAFSFRATTALPPAPAVPRPTLVMPAPPPVGAPLPVPRPPIAMPAPARPVPLRPPVPTTLPPAAASPVPSGAPRVALPPASPSVPSALRPPAVPAAPLPAPISPREAARQLIGEASAGAAQRSGGLLGLPGNYVDHVRRARQQLESGDPAQLKQYLTRMRRDRRFDRAVEKAIKAGKPVPREQAKRATQRYAERLLANHVDMLAKKDAAEAFGAGREAIYEAMIERGVPREAIEGTWRTRGDDKVRHTHAGMGGQVAAVGTPFRSPSGALLRYPGDSGLGAGWQEIAGCRCTVAYTVKGTTA